MTLADFPQKYSLVLEFAQAFGQETVADAGDSLAELTEAARALEHHSYNCPGPAAADKFDRFMEGLAELGGGFDFVTYH